MNKYKKQFTGLIILTVLVSILLPAAMCLAANIADEMRDTLKPANLPGGDEDPEGTALKIVGNVINIFLGFMGIVFFTLIVYGGYTWMTARGKEEDVQKAKDIIRAAIIGLIVIMAAFALSYFITTRIEQAIQQ